MHRQDIIDYLNDNVANVTKFEVDRGMIIIHFSNGDEVDITSDSYSSDLDLGFERMKSSDPSEGGKG